MKNFKSQEKENRLKQKIEIREYERKKRRKRKKNQSKQKQKTFGAPVCGACWVLLRYCWIWPLGMFVLGLLGSSMVQANVSCGSPWAT